MAATVIQFITGKCPRCGKFASGWTRHRRFWFFGAFYLPCPYCGKGKITESKIQKEYREQQERKKSRRKGKR